MMDAQKAAKMTNQELFNTAVAGLASQGFQRSMNDEHCMYRAEDGRRCAIGWVIPDEVYTEKMESFGIISIMEKGLISFPNQPLFLRMLQNAHDDGSFPDLMKEILRKVATEWCLSMPVELEVENA